MCRFSLISISIFLLTSSILYGQERASWTIHLPDLPDRPGYYQGLGIAQSTGDPSEDWNTAINRARADLAGQLYVHIISETTNIIRELEINDESEVESYFGQEVQAASQMILQEVMVQRWFDQERDYYYAYVAVPKGYMVDLRSELLNNAQYVLHFYQELADEFLDSEKIYAAVLIYNEGIEALFRIQDNVRGIQDASQTSYTIDQIITRYETDFCELLNRIEIRSEITPEYKLDSNQPYPNLIAGDVMYLKGENEELLNVTSQFSIAVTAKNGFKAELRIDNTGENFYVHLSEIHSAGSSNELSVFLNITGKQALIEKSAVLRSCLNRLEKTETIHIKGRRDTQIAVYVEEIVNGVITEDTHATEAIRSSLSQLGFEAVFGKEVCNQAQRLFDGYRVCGTLRMNDRSNPRPNFYFATAGGTIEIIENSNGTILDVLQPEELRDGGSSFAQARDRAKNNLSNVVSDHLREFFNLKFDNVSH